MKRSEIINELENKYLFENRSSMIEGWYTLRSKIGVIYDCQVRTNDVLFHIEIDNIDISMTSNEHYFSFNQIAPNNSPINTIFHRFKSIINELNLEITNHISNIEKSIDEIKPDRIFSIEFANGSKIEVVNKEDGVKGLSDPIICPSFKEIRKALLPDQINDLVEQANKYSEFRIKE